MVAHIGQTFGMMCTVCWEPRVLFIDADTSVGLRGGIRPALKICWIRI